MHVITRPFVIAPQLICYDNNNQEQRVCRVLTTFELHGAHGQAGGQAGGEQWHLLCFSIS
jgi:hypothetical protein